MLRFSVARAAASCVSVRAIALLCACAFSGAAFADDPVIVRVEEDWVLEVAEPNPADDAPQITTCIAPQADLECVHGLLELNHATMPDYAAGGLQLQKLYGDWVSWYGNFPQYHKLNTNHEVIEWTMSLEQTGEHTVRFEIEDGTSQTWGNFGGQGYLKVFGYSPNGNLNNYSPTFSVANSRVGYAAHRVERLCIKEVRYYTAAGLYQRDVVEKHVLHRDHEHE